MYYFAILEMYSLSLVSTITDRLVGFSGGSFLGQWCGCFVYCRLRVRGSIFFGLGAGLGVIGWLHVGCMFGGCWGLVLAGDLPILV